MIYDFFIGHELNPRIGPLDLKFFCELRPGLIGWVILDLSYLIKACELYGSPSPALVIVVIFHAFYVADALWFEVRFYHICTPLNFPSQNNITCNKAVLV